MNGTLTRMIAASAALLGVGAVSLALSKPPAKPAGGDQDAGESEQAVKEGEVPKAALDTLRKLANGAAFTGFAREVEHGHTFYEGSWKGVDGNIDAVVTESGDLVAVEETVSADKVPSAAREAVAKLAGKNAKVTMEKKTMVLFEAHWQVDGKEHEMIFTPDAREYNEKGANGKSEKDEDDEKHEDQDDDKD